MADELIPVGRAGNSKRYRDMGDGSVAEVVAVSANIAVGDVEIGAVELKNGTDDTRAKVAATGSVAEGDNAVAVQAPVLGATADAVIAAGAAGTIAAKLRAISRDLVANIVLAAGSAIIGKVGIDQTTPGTTDSVTVKSASYGAAVSLTRTNDTNAYTAGDVIGAATGSTAALTFAIAPSAGGQIMITSVSLEIDVTSIPSGMTSFTLHLYNVTPPSALGDNAAWDLPSGDRASYLGKVALGSPLDLGSTLRVQSDALNIQITAASGNVFGYLVTDTGYTPTASAVKVITLHSLAL